MDVSELGTTLMHEHILFFSGPRQDNPNYTAIPDDLRSDSVDFAASLLNDASRVGIDTVVDLTPYRPIDLYEQIAKRTTVKIIASTGYYRRSKVPKWMADMDDEKQMEERMLKEVTEGIDGTKIQAGIIKVAGAGIPLSDWEQKAFRGAARVQKATGVPIGTHDGAGAREQFDLLVRTGANPRRLFFSHVDTMLHGGRTREQVGEELLSMAKEGGYLEFDTFGQEFYTPWPNLVFFLRSLCDAGFANRVFISIDCNWYWRNREKVFEGAEAPYFDPHASERTYAYMVTDAVPKLLKSGFSKKEIETFLIHNPRRYFSEG
jgi:phosphotriesterase-related protein